MRLLYDVYMSTDTTTTARNEVLWHDSTTWLHVCPEWLKANAEVIRHSERVVGWKAVTVRDGDRCFVTGYQMFTEEGILWYGPNGGDAYRSSAIHKF